MLWLVVSGGWGYALPFVFRLYQRDKVAAWQSQGRIRHYDCYTRNHISLYKPQ